MSTSTNNRPPRRFGLTENAAGLAEENARLWPELHFAVERDPDGTGWFVVACYDRSTGEFEGLL